jgi:hypothetical protein
MERILYGVTAGLALLAWLVLAPWPGVRWRDPAWLVCLMLPVYMLHQFEEYGINLLGQRYHFPEDLCAVLGHPQLADCPATPAFFLAVNCGGGVWIPGVLAILLRRSNVMVGACAMGIPLVNSVVHIGAAIARARYNSGLLTGIILFIPMCAWTLAQLRRAGVLTPRRLAGVVASGVLTHATLVASLFAHEGGLIGQGALDAINVANGVIPLALGFLLR